MSYKTVSRVVNGEPNVRAATRLRVQAAVADLGYRPDHAARSLRGGRSQTLRLLLVRSRDRFLTEPFLDQVVAGVVDRAARDGYALLLEVASPDDDALAAPGVAARRVDGTILIDSRRASPLIPALTPARLPCVVLPTRPTAPGVGWVYADFRGGAAGLVAHLAALGHRRIAHLAGVESLTEQDRRAGYDDGLAAAGIAHDPALIVPAGNQRRLGDAAMGRLLAGGTGVTAVVAVNDATALGAIDALHRHGRRVPEDVSVVGFDDVELATWSAPPLTTMRLPAYGMGVAAVELAIGGVRDRRPPDGGRCFPVELVVRGSTGPPPPNGPSGRDERGGADLLRSRADGVRREERSDGTPPGEPTPSGQPAAAKDDPKDGRAPVAPPPSPPVRGTAPGPGRRATAGRRGGTRVRDPTRKEAGDGTVAPPSARPIAAAAKPRPDHRRARRRRP